MRCWNAIVLCLLQTHLVTSWKNKATGAQTNFAMCWKPQYDWTNADQVDDVSRERISREIQEPSSSRLKDLTPIFEALTMINEMPFENETIDYLLIIYDMFTNVSTSSLTLSDEEANLTSNILRLTANIVNEIYTNYSDPFDPDFLYPSGLVKLFSEFDWFFATKDMDMTMELLKDYKGSNLFEEENFAVSQMCIFTAETRLALVVLPADSSPFRPPPAPGVRVISYHVVHLVLVRDGGFPTADNFTHNCTSGDFFRMIVFSVSSRSELQNVRYGCAQWNDEIKGWSSEYCLPVKEFLFPDKGQCNCDTTFSGETTEYVAYEFLEDVAELIELQSLSFGVKDTSDVFAMNKSMDILGTAKPPYSSKSLETLINDVLFNVMQFDASLLVNNCSKTVLDNIGQIMEGVEPSDGSGAIGRGNQLLKSIVFDLDVYKGDPLVAYAFYNSSEHSLDMEYFRSEEEVDYNRMFYKQMECSFMFSKSVVLQNSRYAFIIYPLNKFFKSLKVIDGVKVVASRVLDIFLRPRQNHLAEQDQLVHMYFNPDPKVQLDHGCAYWSASLGNWTTNGCYQNPDIYRGVCTCNMSAHFNESRTRGMFAVLKFPMPIDLYRDSISKEVFNFDILIVPFLMFTLRSLDKSYHGEDTGTVALKLLNDVQDYFFYDGGKLHPQTELEFVQAAGRALVGGEDLDVTDKRLTGDWGCAKFHAIVGSTAHPHTDTVRDFFCRGDARITMASDTAPSLTVRISDSLKLNNAKYAVLIHPVNYNARQLTSIGKRLTRSYGFHVVLVPGEDKEDAVDQFLELTIRQTEFNASLGCSYWKEDIAAWMPDGCRVVEVDSGQMCNCSVSSNFNQSRTYGEYIVYNSVTAFFDIDVFKQFLMEPMDSHSDTAFDSGKELIHNLTLIPFDNNSVFRLLNVYLHLLSSGNALFLRRQQDVGYVMTDLEAVIGKYKLDVFEELTLQFSVYGTEGVNLRNADVAADFFSNAVLSATSTSNASKTVDMTVAVLGFHSTLNHLSMIQGFYLVGEITEQLEYMAATFAVAALLPNSSLACFITPSVVFDRNRFVLIVYPINTCPYPLTMTPSAIFNTRQLDVYIGFDISFTKKIEGLGPFYLIVHFQLTAAPKHYIKISCASWDNDQQRWNVDVCSYQLTNQNPNLTFVACVCNLTDRPVTRIMMYEYTEQPNFSFVDKFEGPKIVFLVGALLSAFGLGVLVLTAILIPKWREELGNKIMINLTAATSLYLVLSIYRETHTIYAASNYGNVGLIVFTACVHYSRLAHYCWGLVMSVLQYKRFSGVVGATTISHLLLKISLFAWGAPLVPLIILLSWDQNVHFCSPDKLTHYVLYLVPVIVITVLNIGLLVAIVWTITNGCGLLDDDELQRHGVDSKEVMIRRIKQTVLMFFLFGIPAVFEMFNDFGDHVVALEYINKILDPIQGFVMFLFFVVIDDKTKGYWHARIYGEKKIHVQVSKKMPMKLQVMKRRRHVQRRPVVEEVPMEEIVTPRVVESCGD